MICFLILQVPLSHLILGPAQAWALQVHFEMFDGSIRVP
jgi:hypothetical protein